MPNLLQPTQGSRENIQHFLSAIEDQAVRDLLDRHLSDILNAGRLVSSDKNAQQSRDAFLTSVAGLIQQRVSEEQV